jgi:hypothetical protein
MANELRTEVEHVKEQEDVKQALKQTSADKTKKKPKAKAKDKVWLGTHAIILVGLIVFYGQTMMKQIRGLSRNPYPDSCRSIGGAPAI